MVGGSRLAIGPAPSNLISTAKAERRAINGSAERREQAPIDCLRSLLVRDGAYRARPSELWHARRPGQREVRPTQREIGRIRRIGE